jgi:hypothetical protein
MTIIVALAIVVGIGVLLYLNAGRSKPGGSGTEADLLQLCRGDMEQMDRLITHEIQKTPGLSRNVAVSRAIHAMRRDNR